MIRVTQVRRKPRAGNHSIERYFDAMRAEMPGDVVVRDFVVPYESSGVVRRVIDTLAVAMQRGDVVHVTGDIHFVLAAVRRGRSVLTVHDCGTASARRGLARRIFEQLWLRIPVRRAGRVVAVSEFTADELAAIAGVPRERIAVIPTTIGDEYVPAPPPANTRPVVLCFCHSPNKNVDRVIEAVAGLDVHLNIIGALPRATQLLLAGTGVSHTAEHGLSDDELHARYVGADAVAFPSLYEGFGMPIVEAQAVGRPVVTSARAPMDEVAGGAACLVDPDDVVSIRAGIERVLGEAVYRDELVAAGLRNRERFRPALAAARYAEIYRELAGERA